MTRLILNFDEEMCSMFATAESDPIKNLVELFETLAAFRQDCVDEEHMVTLWFRYYFLEGMCDDMEAFFGKMKQMAELEI